MNSNLIIVSAGLVGLVLALGVLLMLLRQRRAQASLFEDLRSPAVGNAAIEPASMQSRLRQLLASLHEKLAQSKVSLAARLRRLRRNSEKASEAETSASALHSLESQSEPASSATAGDRPSLADILAASRAVQEETPRSGPSPPPPTAISHAASVPDPPTTPRLSTEFNTPPDDDARVLTYDDARTMALDVFNANYMRMSQEANTIAVERAESFTTLFLQRLE